MRFGIEHEDPSLAAVEGIQRSVDLSSSAGSDIQLDPVGIASALEWLW
ncbi:hypothetical protein [Mycobacterium sp. 236(2023)]|nr:hypothetical protein [Mycobacterium sp. 236(2023)]MDG4664383.1 hypothetical protein [Mycobacterium sp. 236(2023)]